MLRCWFLPPSRFHAGDRIVRAPHFARTCILCPVCVGRGGRLFRIYKFRSMTWDAGHRGPVLPEAGIAHYAIGRWLRKLKLDELPQFYNILRGEMSLVVHDPNCRAIPHRQHALSPGITGAATLAFRREEGMLSRFIQHLDDYYSQHIRPLKTRMDVRYMCRATF